MNEKQVFACSLCKYSTKRKYNLVRHMKTMHNPNQKDKTLNIDGASLNVESGALNIESGSLNIESSALNIESHDANVESHCDAHVKCPSCYKTFKHVRYLHAHESVCSHVQHKHECKCCHKVCASASALCHHKKYCKGLTQENFKEPMTTHETPEESMSSQNITQTNHIHAHAVQNGNTIINNHNTYLLGFPDEYDSDFKYVKDHINHPLLEKYWKGRRPEIGFRMYANAILERTENRNIYKSNPNTKYCKVYRDNQWEMELDKDAMPIVTNQLSIAALEDVHQYREKIKRTRIDVATILRYLEDINTENDENDNYKDAEDRIRLIIINMSQRWGLPTLEV
jgi:hypothetical protein